MNPDDDAFTVRQINQLHAEVVEHTGESRKYLHAALAAAWHAGHLLLSERTRVRRTMGDAWGQWLAQKFHGSQRTAYNYMRLADTVLNVAEFEGMSLRQVYFRLGIATEPKCRTAARRVPKLPAHIRLANRLLVTLNHSNKKYPPNDAGRSAALRQDLRALYERLRPLFETGAQAGFADPYLPDR